MIASHSGAVPPTHCDADTLARNVYPLAYWASLLSLPALAKRALLYALQACSIPRQAVGMELVNLLTIGWRPDGVKYRQCLAPGASGGPGSTFVGNEGLQLDLGRALAKLRRAGVGRVFASETHTLRATLGMEDSALGRTLCTERLYRHWATQAVGIAVDHWRRPPRASVTFPAGSVADRL